MKIHVRLEGTFTTEVEVEASNYDDAKRIARDMAWDQANLTPRNDILTEETLILFSTDEDGRGYDYRNMDGRNQLPNYQDNRKMY